jgi:ADP-ribose pyrophosphatase
LSVAAFTKLGEATIHAGGIITLATGTFRAPGGEEFERDIVHHPGAVSAVPLLDDGRVVLVRQYRASIDAHLLEIPAGKRDIADEPPEVTARRELVEEVGYEAGSIELLGRFYNSPGFSDELSYTFLARDLVHVGAQTVGPEEQHMTVETVHLDDVPRLIVAGEITDAKTIVGLLLTRERLDA